MTLIYPDPSSDVLPLTFDRDHPLRHDGPCGRRIRCWRPECLAEFGDMATVEVLPRSSLWLARCHGGRHAGTELPMEGVA